jgi:hypothetical protein
MQQHLHRHWCTMALTCTAAVFGLNLEMRLSTDSNSASIAFASSPLGGTKSCNVRHWCQVADGRYLLDLLDMLPGMIAVAGMVCHTFGGVRFRQNME